MPTEYIVPGPMWVKLRRTQCEQMSSELPLKADHSTQSACLKRAQEEKCDLTARRSAIEGFYLPQVF